jgi:4-amino-4-deoxy-L-arabinose transferase-like glycosyltransferase
LIFVEKNFNIKTEPGIFQISHIISHLFFLLGAYFFYLLLFRLFKKKWLSTLGLLLLISSPLIYGHSFFNSKDLPFLSLFIISIYLGSIAFQTKKSRYFILLGLTIGLLVNIRLMGIMAPVLFISLLVLDGFLENRFYFHFKLACLMVATACITLYITWPYLWSAPIDHFLLAFQNMAKFRYDREMLFMGELIHPTEITWKYIPVWFGITNPIPVLFTGAFGFLALSTSLLKKPFQYLSNGTERIKLVSILLFLAPISAIIILKSEHDCKKRSTLELLCSGP